MRDSTANDLHAAAPGASLADALRAVIVPFLVTRAGVLLAGLAAAVFIGYTPDPGEPSAWRVAADPARNLLARWDTFWYLDIASRGYHWNGNPLEQQNVVFFPLFPLLMRVAGRAIGGHPLLGGLLVSLAAFLLALCYFWRWTADRLGADVATGAVWLLSAFPLALFFSAVYTESLYLLVAVAACYHAERRQFRAVGRCRISGRAGPAERPAAVDPDCVDWRSSPTAIAGPPVSRVVAVIAPVLGVLSFSAYLAWRVGDATAWLADQAAWPNNMGIPSPGAGPSIDLWWIPNALSLGLILASLAPVTSAAGRRLRPVRHRQHRAAAAPARADVAGTVLVGDVPGLRLAGDARPRPRAHRG